LDFDAPSLISVCSISIPVSLRRAYLSGTTAKQKAERGLFALLVSDVHGLFAEKREPNWKAVASRWVGHSDSVKAYWKKWEENVNEKNSIKINQETYDRIAATLGQHSASKTIPTIPPAQPTSIQQQITAGLRQDPVANMVDRQCCKSQCHAISSAIHLDVVIIGVGKLH
jgi:hypothetical protein